MKHGLIDSSTRESLKGFHMREIVSISSDLSNITCLNFLFDPLLNVCIRKDSKCFKQTSNRDFTLILALLYVKIDFSSFGKMLLHL